MEGGAAVDARTFQTEALKIEKLLYHISYAMLRNESDCEDAVQEAVLRAWQRLPGLQNPQFFETWLTRIVINECKSQLRRRSRSGAGCAGLWRTPARNCCGGSSARR